MNRWIISAILSLCCTSQVISGLNRSLEITGSTQGREVPVWIDDHVTIVAINIFVSKWFFNNTSIAESIPNSLLYNYSNISPLGNITAYSDPINSFLNLSNVNHVYSGNYSAEGDPDINSNERFSFRMTVHEVNLSSTGFVLYNGSDSCKAYLFTDDIVNPPNPDILRIANSPDLTFTPTNPSYLPIFEINNSSLNIQSNSMNTTVNIQYTFTNNNFGTIRSKNILLDGSLISKPSAVIVGTPGNYTVLIKHNTAVNCVRTINYCLSLNETAVRCNSTRTLNNLTLEYPWNSTVANLSIVYDIVYAKYQLDMIVTNNSAEATTTTEPITMNSSFTEITSTQPGTTNGTGTSNNSGGLTGWQIALIVVGSVLIFIILLAIIGFCLWKNKSKKKLYRDDSSEYRPAANERILRKTISPTQMTPPLQVQNDRRQPFTTGILSTSLGATERRQYPSTSRYDTTIRPTIPQPTSNPYDRSNRQAPPLSYEQFPQSSTSRSMYPLFDQPQEPYGRRGPLSPTNEIFL